MEDKYKPRPHEELRSSGNDGSDPGEEMVKVPGVTPPFPEKEQTPAQPAVINLGRKI